MRIWRLWATWRRQETPPVREASFHVPLELLEVPRGDRPEAFQAGQLRLEGAPALLPGLNPLQERLEVAALGHRRGEPSQFLVQHCRAPPGGRSGAAPRYRWGLQLPRRRRIARWTTSGCSTSRSIVARIASVRQFHREDRGHRDRPCSRAGDGSCRGTRGPADRPKPGCGRSGSRRSSPHWAKPGQEVARLDAVGRPAPELAVGGPEV